MGEKMVGENVPNIVVPCNRPEKMVEFLLAWREEFCGCNLIVVWDLPKKPSLPLLDEEYKFTVQQFSHKEIDADLKDKSWIIPRKASAIRSYGY